MVHVGAGRGGGKHQGTKAPNAVVRQLTLKPIASGSDPQAGRQLAPERGLRRRDDSVAQSEWIFNSLVDPNTLNLDPDPEFWLNLDLGPDPDPGLYYQLKKKKKNLKTLFF